MQTFRLFDIIEMRPYIAHNDSVVHISISNLEKPIMGNEKADKHNGRNDHKEITIIINGTPKVIQKERLNFDEIIALAFDNPPTGEGVQFTIQYSRGHSDKPKGTLVEGQSVQTKDGMEFDVTQTNRS